MERLLKSAMREPEVRVEVEYSEEWGTYYAVVRGPGVGITTEGKATEWEAREVGLALARNLGLLPF